MLLMFGIFNIYLITLPKKIRTRSNIVSFFSGEKQRDEEIHRLNHARGQFNRYKYIYIHKCCYLLQTKIMRKEYQNKLF